MWPAEIFGTIGRIYSTACLSSYTERDICTLSVVTRICCQFFCDIACMHRAAGYTVAQCLYITHVLVIMCTLLDCLYEVNHNTQGVENSIDRPNDKTL